MTFGWPLVLLSLLSLPVLVAGYAWALRRRRRGAVLYSSVALIRRAAPPARVWRRHVPFALVVAALACLGLAGSRPQVTLKVPVAGSTVILAVDVSGSMCATDVSPNRLSAAQTAVRDFVRDQAKGTRIGLVAFSGFAQVAVAPTTERKPLLDAIEGLTTGRGTAIGAAILKSVNAIAEIDPRVPPVDEVLFAAGTAPPSSAPVAPRQPPAPEIVVLLTDGANTVGVEPMQAAQAAATRGVRIYPIGFGTARATSLVCTAKQQGGEGFGRGPGGLGWVGASRNYLVADEETLRQVATITGGTFFAAKGADQLQGVLGGLPRQVRSTERDIEVSAGLAGLAAFLVLLSVWAAVRWSPFPS